MPYVSINIPLRDQSILPFSVLLILQRLLNLELISGDSVHKTGMIVPLDHRT